MTRNKETDLSAALKALKDGTSKEWPYGLGIHNLKVKLGFSETTTRRLIDELRKRKLIRINPRPNNSGMRGRHVYYFSPMPTKKKSKATVANARRKKAVLSRQSDPTARSKVEAAAIKYVWSHFRAMGYDLVSVAKDNIGWDLEATNGKEKLRLEVKGLSGNVLSVELTPNEFDKMLKLPSFRLCVVTSATTSPQLTVFAPETDGSWKGDGGQVLRIETRMAARCSLS